MLIVAECARIVCKRKITRNEMRSISKYLHKDRLSKNVRQRFLDYFINDNNHNFVRSSPVIPYCDPTVAFVNAGMNQVLKLSLLRNIRRCDFINSKITTLYYVCDLQNKYIYIYNYYINTC